MKTGRSPEVDVLLKVCSEVTAEVKDQLTQLLARHSIDWERLHVLANRHRVAPFLYRMLQQMPGIPAPFLTALQNDCRTSATDTLIKLHEYGQLKKLLDEHGIRHVAMKGVYLVQHAYPDSSLRSIGDFDILIGRKDLFQTIRLLENYQYRLGDEYKHYLRQGERMILRDLHEVSLFKPFFAASHFNIDLHWEVECFNKYYASFHLEDVLADPARVLEQQVILLVVHHGLINIWQHIGYINDLFFMLNDKPVDWDYLMRQLADYELDGVFLAGLYWCRQIWSIDLPAAIREQVETERIRLLAEAYEPYWESPESVLVTNPGLKQIDFFVNSQTQLSKKAKIYRTYVYSLVFRPSTFRLGKRLVYLPKELGFIKAFVRAVRLLTPNQR